MYLKRSVREWSGVPLSEMDMEYFRAHPKVANRLTDQGHYLEVYSSDGELAFSSTCTLGYDDPRIEIDGELKLLRRVKQSTFRKHRLEILRESYKEPIQVIDSEHNLCFTLGLKDG